MLSAELNGVRRMEYRVSKKISGELHFDADPATVYTMVSDQAYVQEKNERTGGQNVEAEVTDNGAEGCKIVVSRDLPAEIPAFAKKFVGEKISTVQNDEDRCRRRWERAPRRRRGEGISAIRWRKTRGRRCRTVRSSGAQGTGSRRRVADALRSGIRTNSQD